MFFEIILINKFFFASSQYISITICLTSLVHLFGSRLLYFKQTKLPEAWMTIWEHKPQEFLNISVQKLASQFSFITWLLQEKENVRWLEVLKYKLPLKSKLYFCQIKIVPKLLTKLIYFFSKHNESKKERFSYICPVCADRQVSSFHQWGTRGHYTTEKILFKCLYGDNERRMREVRSRFLKWKSQEKNTTARKKKMVSPQSILSCYFLYSLLKLEGQISKLSKTTNISEV